MSLVQYHSTTDRSVQTKSVFRSPLLRTVLLLFLWMGQPVHFADALPSSDFQKLISELSRQLTQSVPPGTNPGPVLVVNFVDLSQLHCTSRFGELTAERLRNLLMQAGWHMLEPRTGLKIKIEKDKGPYILSDQTKDLAQKIHCTAVLVGTYLFHQGTISINARLVAVPSNSVLSAATADAPCDPFMFALLQPEGFGCQNPEAFIRIKPFSNDHSSPMENDTTELEEKYFKEDVIQ